MVLKENKIFPLKEKMLYHIRLVSQKKSLHIEKFYLNFDEKMQESPQIITRYISIDKVPVSRFRPKEYCINAIRYWCND